MDDKIRKIERKEKDIAKALKKLEIADKARDKFVSLGKKAAKIKKKGK